MAAHDTTDSLPGPKILDLLVPGGGLSSFIRSALNDSGNQQLFGENSAMMNLQPQQIASTFGNLQISDA
ncbi:MAG TPA: hypothetical protein V6C69_18455 [Trichormus sp.]